VNIEIELSSDERDRIAHALGDVDDVDDVDRIIDLIGRAGAREALAQASGLAVFSAIADLKLFRIFCMLQEGMGLGEAERFVGAVFKVPSSTAKRWVNASIARYRVELDSKVVESVTELLEAASWNSEATRWDVRMPSLFIRERISGVLEGMDQPDPTSAQRGPVWGFPNETYQALRGQFGLGPRGRP
jgi:hypothetical protein